jgi:type IX secretion system PorP/SprF family membrane protein
LHFSFSLKLPKLQHNYRKIIPMKRTFLIIAGSLICQFLLAQQIPQYSLEMLNPFSSNPAYAGLEPSLEMTATMRSQWVGIPGQPRTQQVNAHMPLYIFSSGVGIKVENQTIGAEQGTKGLLAYDYHLYLGKGILSGGVAAGVVSRSLDGSKLLTPEGSYNEPGNFTHNDDILPTTNISLTIPTINFGVYYQSEKLEGGFSIQNINEGRGSQDGVSLRLIRHYYMSVATHFEINSALSLHPSLSVRTDTKELQTYLSLLAHYNDNIFGGVSFRGYSSNTFDALALIGGFTVNDKLSIAYAYDISLSKLKNINSGSHEIQITYSLEQLIGKGKLPKIIYNPRFL